MAFQDERSACNSEGSRAHADARSQPQAGPQRVRFVAEVSSNHHGDLERCLDFVDRAAEIGCDAVKFQLFRVDELFAPEILQRSAVHRERRSWELPTPFLAELALRARTRGLAFSCTPFSLAAVSEIAPHVDFVKIASYELLWDPLLVACARTQRPLVLSTGMADAREVDHALRVLRRAGCRDLTLLHCVSGYPTPPSEANLASIGALRSLAHSAGFERCQIGWSDHSISPAVVQRAVHRHGAEMIEFHLDLDGRGSEFASGHCWLPEAIEAVIADVRCGVAADGHATKAPAPSELADRSWRADPRDGLRPLAAIRPTWQP